MGFVKFTEVGKNFTPRVTIHPTGVVHFNQGARKKFSMDDFTHCVMYLDADRHAVGFELVNDENVEGANRLRHVQREGLDLNARSFLDHFRLRFKRPISFALRKSLENEWLVLNLEDGEVQWSEDKDSKRMDVDVDENRRDDDDADNEDMRDDGRDVSLVASPRSNVKAMPVGKSSRDDVRRVSEASVANAVMNGSVSGGQVRARGVKAMLSELLQD